jgi:hypothetical protein
LRYLLLAGKYAVTVDILASAGKLEYGAPNHADHLLNKNPISANFDFSSVYVARVSWFFLFLLVGVVYWPGLSGPFVLDDFGSIKALGDRGGVVDWETFKAFVLGGNSGPTGRPVSLVTFLIDANNWPADSWPFKRTNLIIHCLCGALLGTLIQQILLLLRFERRDARWLAFAAAGIWLLHPFLVSTTLYVVQRMAQLATLFSLAGLAVYVRGRVMLPRDPRCAYIMMTASIVVFGLLATLSKENGLLLPLFAAVVESTVVASQRDTLGRLNRYWSVLFLVLPAVVILVYLGRRMIDGNFMEIVPPRDFSGYERALTQPRILFDYLQHWYFPKLYTTGVFQDHFGKSTGLFAPLTTILSLLAHIGIISLAVVKRHRWPLLALTALIFYSSHLLESTVVNLELYFEHRNYLASGFLFLPLLVAIHRRTRLRHFLLICLIVFAILGSFTRYSSSVWSSWPSMIEASAHKAPTSARAQAQYSLMLFKAGRHAESLVVLDRAIETISGPKPLLKVSRLVTLCQLDQLSPAEFDAESRELSRLSYDVRMIAAYSALADAIVAGMCPGITTTRLNTLFTDMLLVPYNAIPEAMAYSQIQYLVGFSHAYSGHRQAAVAAFQESLSARSGASHAMQMAAVLASNEFGVDALHFSDLALAELKKRSADLLSAAVVSETDIRIFQATVRADIKALQDADTSREEQ